MEQLDWNTFNSAVLAARAAFVRAVDAGEAGEPMAAKTAAVEAIWWIAASREALIVGLSRPGHTWTEYRDSIEWGAEVDGLYWARSKAIHDPYALATLATVDGDYHDSYTDRPGVLIFAEPNSIVQAELRPKSTGRIEYAKLLAGKPILIMLDRILQSLEATGSVDIP